MSSNIENFRVKNNGFMYFNLNESQHCSFPHPDYDFYNSYKDIDKREYCVLFDNDYYEIIHFDYDSLMLIRFRDKRLFFMDTHIEYKEDYSKISFVKIPKKYKKAYQLSIFDFIKE